MTTTILYCITRLDQRRVFQSMEDYGDKNIKQYFIGPPIKTVVNSKFTITEDYLDFKIEKKFLRKDKSDFRKLIGSFKPDIFVCGSTANIQRTSFKKKCKKVFVSHGLIGDHIYDLKEINKKKFYKQWVGSDLYCGAGENFNRWITEIPGQNPSIEIITNALPQLDIVYNNMHNNEYKNKLIEQKEIPIADKYILFAGFAGYTRSDFINNNEDYYRTAVYLEKIAKKNNWFVFIKPRITKKRDMKFIKGSKYASDYYSLWESDNVCVVNPLESVYKYFFSDIIVVNGTSTIEVEACCANKPLVMIKTKDDLDPLKTVSIGGAKLVSNDTIGSLEEALVGSFDKNILCYNEILEYHGISFDGKMSERVSDAILKLI